MHAQSFSPQFHPHCSNSIYKSEAMLIFIFLLSPYKSLINAKKKWCIILIILKTPGDFCLLLCFLAGDSHLSRWIRWACITAALKEQTEVCVQELRFAASVCACSLTTTTNVSLPKGASSDFPSLPSFLVLHLLFLSSLGLSLLGQLC